MERLGGMEEGLLPSFDAITQNFMERGRKLLGYQTFVAYCEGKPVGSVSCQQWEGIR
jgi:hypothetical protein